MTPTEGPSENCYPTCLLPSSQVTAASAEQATALPDTQDKWPRVENCLRLCPVWPHRRGETGSLNQDTPKPGYLKSLAASAPAFNGGPVCVRAGGPQTSLWQRVLMQVTSSWQGNGPVFIHLCWEDGRKRPDAFVCGERSLGPSKTAQTWELLGVSLVPREEFF